MDFTSKESCNLSLFCTIQLNSFAVFPVLSAQGLSHFPWTPTQKQNSRQGFVCLQTIPLGERRSEIGKGGQPIQDVWSRDHRTVNSWSPVPLGNAGKLQNRLSSTSLPNPAVLLAESSEGWALWQSVWPALGADTESSMERGGEGARWQHLLEIMFQSMCLGKPLRLWNSKTVREIMTQLRFALPRPSRMQHAKTLLEAVCKEALSLAHCPLFWVLACSKLCPTQRCWPNWSPGAHEDRLTFINPCEVLISIFKGNRHDRSNPLPVREVESCAWGWLKLC